MKLKNEFTYPKNNQIAASINEKSHNIVDHSCICLVQLIA